MSAILIFIGILVLLLLMPTIWRLNLSLWGSIFQIYTVPILGVYPSLAMVSNLSLAPNLFKCKNTLLKPPILVLLLLIAWQLISLAWSPDKRLGLATVIYELPFIVIFAVSYNIFRENKKYFSNIAIIYALLSFAPLITLILFRFHFDIDAAFLQTSIGSTLINPNTIAISPYNNQQVDLLSLVQSYLETTFYFGNWLIDKPHGFFMNPNTCAGYFGICSLLFWGSGSYFSSRLLKAFAILHWLSLFLIASIAAIILAFILPGAMLGIHHYKSNPLKCKVKPIILLFAGISLTFSLIIFIFNYPGIASVISHKMEARLVLWRAAMNIHDGHLFSGLGFGGWQIEYDKYRLTTAYHPLLEANYPPHNTLIQLWTQSGFIALLLGIAFITSILTTCWRAYSSLNNKHEKMFSLCIMAAFAWVFLQGMGENWGIVAEMHIQPILAVCFALLMTNYAEHIENIHA